MPFTCEFEGCGRTYQRKEHLNRHVKDHDAVRSFECPACDAKFSRGDTLRRHMNLHGPRASAPLPGRVAQACVHCHRNKTRCDGKQPSCTPCSDKGRACSYPPRGSEREAGSDQRDSSVEQDQDSVGRSRLSSSGSASASDDRMDIDNNHEQLLSHQNHHQSHQNHHDVHTTANPATASNATLLAQTPSSYQSPATSGVLVGGGMMGAAYHQQQHQHQHQHLRQQAQLHQPPSRSDQDSMSLLLTAATAFETGDKNDALQECYFQRFHPDWPLLHRESFVKMPQPKPLVQAVTTLGLFFFGTPEARAMAKQQHVTLMADVQVRLSELLARARAGEINAPTAELLPHLQALMIPFLMCPYRRDKCLTTALTMNTDLIELFKRVGVFEQSEISAASQLTAESSLPWVVRESYQRLALLHFKFHLLGYTVFITLFPWVKIPRDIEPSMLNVRVPYPKGWWDNQPAQWDPSGVNPANFATSGPANEDENSALLVSGMCARVLQTGRRDSFLPLFAWDRNLGMALCICLNKKEEEPDNKFIERLKPFIHTPLKIGPRPGEI